MIQSRLLVVSNRLPLTLSKSDGKWQVSASSGGLATAMEPILNDRGGLWIGWSGDDGTIDPAERNELLSQSSPGFSYVSVDFPPGAAQAFYEGYPNQTVWPLFHVFPSRMAFGRSSWSDYVDGNRRFAATVGEHAQAGDLVWIHDYHLMLLPDLVRELQKGVKIGYFLHIPFPASEVFSMLPHGNEVLRGLLGADFIAFHTHRDLHHFRSSLLRILGVESTMDAVEYQGRRIKIEALPIGIEPEKLSNLVKNDPETMARIEELRQRYAGKRLMVAVDRLDYSKGIPERLRTFRRLLSDEPDLRGVAVLIQVAVPSREGMEEYQSLGLEINQLVGEINGEFGNANWTPILYLRHSISKSELAALYSASEIGWVTPLRDGMNLVAKEYCACKPNGDGVLVLSRFAGAAAEMGEALLVNPYDEEDVASAILQALAMPKSDRVERMDRLRERVNRNDVFHWAERFVRGLQASGETKQPSVDRLDIREVQARFSQAAGRMLILDFESLVPIVEDPARCALLQPLGAVLSQLAENERNLVSVVSARRSSDLDKWVGGIPNLILGAEHGALVRHPQARTWEPLYPNHPPLTWKARVREILEQFTDRAPGSFFEEKKYSLLWDYRSVEPEFGKWIAGELTSLLVGLLADSDARPVVGHNVLEVLPVWATKESFVSHLVKEYPQHHFRLVVGNDVTGEDTGINSGPESYTFDVGFGPSRARYHLKDSSSVLVLLNDLRQNSASLL